MASPDIRVQVLAASFEPGEDVQLDASKLHCYQVALELHTLCSTLVAALNRIVRDQLERASLSVVCNIAEGGGRRSRRDKAKYYAIARGSATEVAALLDVLPRAAAGLTREHQDGPSLGDPRRADAEQARSEAARMRLCGCSS